VRKLLALAAIVLVLLFPARGVATSGGRPVALVTAETANEVLAVSLGKYGGHILRRIHLVDPLMIASADRGPAVVVNPRGTVTLLAWHNLRPIKTFHDFRSPKMAEVTPDGELAYVTDERTGDLTVIDLARHRIVGRVFVGLQAHHLAISPDGSRIWVALGETATTIVRLNASNPRKPRVVGRIHPPGGAHDIGFTPDGTYAWVTSPTAERVAIYSPTGKLLEGAKAGRGPQHVAFSGSSALISSGYSSSLESISWRAPAHRLRTVTVPYGSFNLATHGGFVVTTSLFTGQVTELRVSNLHRLWTTRVAPAARYVAISVWPR
jgi:DNA-binding beta-propeller fold protein YncE